MLAVNLRPDGRRAVVVGGGPIAARKAQTLLDAGFAVAAIAPEFCEAMQRLFVNPALTASPRACGSDDLDGAALAVAATGVDAVDAQVVAGARTRGIPVCDASRPARGTLQFPATATLGDVTIAVDTAGTAPGFAARIAEDVAGRLGARYERATRTMAAARSYAKLALTDAERSEVLRALAHRSIDDLAAMNPGEAEHAIDDAVERLRASRSDAPGTPERRALTCASRGSALAMVQTRSVAATLAQRGVATRILTLQTTGDRDRTTAIDRIGSTSVFVGELEGALRDGRADYAVHSAKDLPGELASDMRLAAISRREDPRDAFCSARYREFAALPPEAVVGTSSPRRRLLLAAWRPDLRYEDIRGNVDTRLRKLAEGGYDAIVLAMAGLRRLDVRAAFTVPFEIDVLVPAVAQGALAIETRANDADTAALLREALNDPESERAVACERAALRALEAGCSAPIGIYARLQDGRLLATGALVRADGSVVRAELHAPLAGLEHARYLGRRLASFLGAAHRPLAILGRTRTAPSQIAGTLRAAGVEVMELRAGDAGPDPAERPPDMLLFPSSGAVDALGSYLPRLTEAGAVPVTLAMGPQSARAAAQAGFDPHAVAEDASRDALAALAREWLAL